jgi:hypothetical protein
MRYVFLGKSGLPKREAGRAFHGAWHLVSIAFANCVFSNILKVLNILYVTLSDAKIHCIPLFQAE